MGFTYNDVHSKAMGVSARLTSWQVCGNLRNFTTTVPGKYGVTDFGSDFDYREIAVSCNIFPQKNFTALVQKLDAISAWLDPTSLHQLIFDDVPDRYFMARLNAAVDCERLIRAAGSFELKFFCPDPFGYALEDETFSITTAGTAQTVTRAKGNADSLPVYALHGVSAPSADSSITISVNDTVMKIVNALLLESETLMVDADKMTAWVENENGVHIRSALPYLQDVEFPALKPGANSVSVSVQNATFTSLGIQAKSRWR